jgi:hypothetical protein
VPRAGYSHSILDCRLQQQQHTSHITYPYPLAAGGELTCNMQELSPRSTFGFSAFGTISQPLIRPHVL